MYFPCRMKIGTYLKDMVNDERMADVEFVFKNGEPIYAHNSVINSLCPILHRIIEDRRMITNSERVKIKSTKQRDTIMHLMFYLYTGEINRIDDKHLYEVYKLWSSLEVKGFEELEKMITSSDELVLVFMQRSIREDYKPMRSICKWHIAINFSGIIKTETILNVNSRTMKNIMKIRSLGNLNQVEVIRVFMKWAHRSCERKGIPQTAAELRQRLNHILEYIQFMEMTDEQLVDCIIMIYGIFDLNETFKIMTEYIHIIDNVLREKFEKYVFRLRNAFSFFNKSVLEVILFYQILSNCV